jgi:two-component system sensor histidine kinase KdpD
VEKVLTAGIDAYTTVNVQHLEMLNDAVAPISSVRVRAYADEIELVDIPSEELLERLREGKVYMPEQAARATQNIFGVGNLTALRELALRAAADQVDAQLRTHMDRHAIAGPGARPSASWCWWTTARPRATPCGWPSAGFPPRTSSPCAT